MKEFMNEKQKIQDEMKLSKGIEKKLRKEFQDLYEKFTQSSEEKFELI